MGSSLRRFLLLTIVLGASCPAFAAWTITNDVQGTSNAQTFSNALTNPSTIIVTCRSSDTSLVASVTDTAGNSYILSPLGQFNTGIGFLNREIFSTWVAANTHTTSSNVVTCHDVAASSWAAATEITGCTTCGVVDGGVDAYQQTPSAGGANAIFFPTPFVTTHDGDFIYVMIVNTAGSSFTAGTSPVVFTLLPASVSIIRGEYTTQATHGSIAPTYGYSGGSITWGGIAIAISTTAAAPAAKTGILPPMMR